jgi:hypothetical protein
MLVYPYIQCINIQQYDIKSKLSKDSKTRKRAMTDYHNPIKGNGTSCMRNLNPIKVYPELGQTLNAFEDVWGVSKTTIPRDSNLESLKTNFTQNPVEISFSANIFIEIWKV